MVTYNQLITGITKYINECLSAGNNNTFILKFGLNFLLRSKEAAMAYIKDRFGGIIDTFALMDGDNINIKAIYEVALETMNDAPYKFETPLGNLTVTPADLTKAYEMVVNS